MGYLSLHHIGCGDSCPFSHVIRIESLGLRKVVDEELSEILGFPPMSSLFAGCFSG